MDGLGDALRGWRSGVRPEDVGLPRGGPRRTPGLRREELAQLAGVSADYIARLEQGRADAPSGQVLGALARALRLDADQRAHLYALAGRALPPPGSVPQHIAPSVQRLLDQLAGTPIGVFDASWTLLVWNRLWAALLGDPSDRNARERNSIWRHFVLGDGWVEHTPQQEEDFEASTVADLRSTVARYPDDANVRRLITDLRASSPAFERRWASNEVGRHTMASKLVRHPLAGDILLDCDVLTVSDGDLRLVAYTAQPGSESAERIRLLDVIGTQELI